MMLVDMILLGLEKKTDVGGKLVGKSAPPLPPENRKMK